MNNDKNTQLENLAATIRAETGQDVVVVGSEGTPAPRVVDLNVPGPARSLGLRRGIGSFGKAAMAALLLSAAGARSEVQVMAPKRHGKAEPKGFYGRMLPGGHNPQRNAQRKVVERVGWRQLRRARTVARCLARGDAAPYGGKYQ